MSEIRAKHEMDEQKEIEKAAKRKNDLLSATQSNMVMIEKKKQLEADQRQRDLIARRQAEQAYKDGIEEEKSKKAEKMKKMHEMKTVLDGQVEYRRKLVQNSQVLTEEEKLLNKVILAVIEFASHLRE
jgi:hypothetical protein